MRYVQKVLILLILSIFFIPRYSCAQKVANDIIAAPVYKNAIKGMPILLPFVFGYVYAGLSTGYERYIGKHHGLELCGYYYYNMDEMGAQFHNFSIKPGYKYFTKSPKERYNNFWAGIYLSYYHEYQTVSDGDGGSNRQYNYGIGVSVGKKINLSLNKRWFLDLGFGVSYNKYFSEPIFSDTEWKDKFEGDTFHPRPVLQIGRKF